MIDNRPASPVLCRSCGMWAWHWLTDRRVCETCLLNAWRAAQTWGRSVPLAEALGDLVPQPRTPQREETRAA